MNQLSHLTAEDVLRFGSFDDPVTLRSMYSHVSELAPPFAWGQLMKLCLLGLLDKRLQEVDKSWESQRIASTAMPRASMAIGQPAPQTISDRDLPAVGSAPSPMSPGTVVPNTVPRHVANPPVQTMGDLPFVEVKNPVEVPPGFRGDDAKAIGTPDPRFIKQPEAPPVTVVSPPTEAQVQALLNKTNGAG